MSSVSTMSTFRTWERTRTTSVAGITRTVAQIAVDTGISLVGQVGRVGSGRGRSIAIARRIRGVAIP